MIEIRRRISTPFSGASAIPATVADPDVGASSVPSVRTVVVLPAPLGPRKPKTSPWPISNETSSNATLSLKRLLGFAAEGAGPPTGPKSTPPRRRRCQWVLRRQPTCAQPRHDVLDPTRQRRVDLEEVAGVGQED